MAKKQNMSQQCNNGFEQGRCGQCQLNCIFQHVELPEVEESEDERVFDYESYWYEQSQG